MPQLYQSLRQHYESPLLQNVEMSYHARLNSTYTSFFMEHGHQLGHYFRNLYRILKYIDEKAGEDAKDYAGLVRAQLSEPELLLALYNGISVNGGRFKGLAEKYALFESLDLNRLINKQDDVVLYNPEAFGEQLDMSMNWMADGVSCGVPASVS